VDAPSVRNTVNAVIVGVPFPFIGVDGTDACPQIYLPDGNKAGCPLKAGQEYVYKNSFKILDIYPKVSLHTLTFHTALLTTLSTLVRLHTAE
jgi:Niemann-Pick C2 protein